VISPASPSIARVTSWHFTYFEEPYCSEPEHLTVQWCALPSASKSRFSSSWLKTGRRTRRDIFFTSKADENKRDTDVLPFELMAFRKRARLELFHCDSQARKGIT
jgi:hypothetical protein